MKNRYEVLENRVKEYSSSEEVELLRKGYGYVEKLCTNDELSFAFDIADIVASLQLSVTTIIASLFSGIKDFKKIDFSKVL